PVVTGQAAPHLHPHRAGREVELVVDHYDAGGVLDAEASHEEPHRLTRQVHERLRERQCHTVVAPVDLGGEGPLAAAAQLGAAAPGQLGDDLGTDVVAAAGVLLAGVAETDDQPVGRGAAPLTAPRQPAQLRT